MKGPVSVYLLSASKNFVRKGSVNDVASYWRRFETDCSFRLLSNSWKLIQKFSAGLFLGEGMLQSLAILYVEYALARKIKYDKIISDFEDKSPVYRRSPTICSNRLLGVIRSTGALFRANSWHLQTVQLRRELGKYVMGVWSDNFTAGVFVSFILTVFVPDIEGVKKKAICFWIGTTCSMNVARVVLIVWHQSSRTFQKAHNLK